MQPKPKFKIWLETDKGYVFGPGAYSLLKQIKKTGKLTDAAKALDMSYRHAWGLIKKAEKSLGKPLLSTHKGGKAGGGTDLTKLGREYLSNFEHLISLIDNISENIDLPTYPSENTQEATIKQITKKENYANVTFNISNKQKIDLKISLKEIEKKKLEMGDRVLLNITSFVNQIKIL